MSEEDFIIEENTRLVQLVGPNHENIKTCVVEKIIETIRGENGLGSTGV